MADGVMIQPNPLWNVTKLKIAWMEWRWVAMADGVMIQPNPLWNVTKLKIAWMEWGWVAMIGLCGDNVYQVLFFCFELSCSREVVSRETDVLCNFGDEETSGLVGVGWLLGANEEEDDFGR